MIYRIAPDRVELGPLQFGVWVGLSLSSAAGQAMPRGRRCYGLFIAVLCCLYASRMLLPPNRSGKLTVILSAYETTGLRPTWLQRTCHDYVSSSFSDIVDQVILVWNEPTAEPPSLPGAVTVVRGQHNSMNNR